MPAPSSKIAAPTRVVRAPPVNGRLPEEGAAVPRVVDVVLAAAATVPPAEVVLVVVDDSDTCGPGVVTVFDGVAATRSWVA